MGMVDFHTHILPAVDDGSQSVEESLTLLAESARQGMAGVCATPHFYPTSDDPERFFARRAAAWQKLSAAIAGRNDLPKIALGAEVHFYLGISRNDDIADFCIGDTGILLLEMPFYEWSENMIREIISLNERRDVTVLLAHIERYLKFQKNDTWDYLRASGVVMQSNAEFFLNRMTAHKAVRMVKKGIIHIIASDCHNMSSRPPKVGDALAALEKNDRELREIIEENVKAVLQFSRQKRE